MRSRFGIGCVGLFVASAVLFAAAQTSGVSPEAATKSIASFLADPLGESAKEDAKRIVAFATESSEVLVVMGEEETGWLKEATKAKKDYAGVLLTAFIAGNVQTQIDLGEKRNDVYSGALQVMRTYREIRKKDPAYRSAAVEELLKKHRDGSLLRHIAEIQERRDAARTKAVRP